jgi:putative membrane protein
VALDAALSVLHFVCVLVLAGALFSQAMLLRLTPRADVIAGLTRADILYAASAVALVLAGGARVFFGAKGSEFYFSSHAFWGKMATFIVVGLLSIPPTLSFRRWRKALRADSTFTPTAADWKSARRVVMAELHLLVLVLIFAALMARGVS